MANKQPSIVPSGTNNYLTPSLSFNRIATDFITPGVVGTFANTAGIAPATGAFAVNAQGSPNMTVAVTGPGVAYVSAVPTGGVAQTFGVTIDATETVTVVPNSSGATVYDFIYLTLDPAKLNNPSSTGLDVPTFTVSVSTTPYAVGGANYGNSNGAQANSLLLGVVTVVNAAASITNSSITDARVRSGSYTNPTLMSNPIKFSVFRAAAWSTSATANQYNVVLHDSKTFDTSANVDLVTNKGRFTAPVAGFYQFSGSVGTLTTNVWLIAALYKNGFAVKIGQSNINAAGSINSSNTVAGLLQLAAGDYVEVYLWVNAASQGGTSGASATYFDGFLVSAT